MSSPFEISLPVYGMNCAGCASKLNAELNEMDDVQANVNITLERATMLLTGNPVTPNMANNIVSILTRKNYQTDYQKVIFDADWSCSGCVQATLKAIKQHPLVLEATANFVTKTLYVDTVSSFINEHFIQQLIELSPSTLTRKMSTTSAQQLLKKQATEKKKQRREKHQLVFALLLSLPFWFAMLSMLWRDTPLLTPWLELALATPLQFWIGARFYKAAWQSLKNKTTNMDVLVVIGTSAAYFFSLYLLLTAHTQHLYFESSSLVIVLIRLGKYLEFRAKQASSQAIQALTQLQVKEALVKKGKTFKKFLIEDVQVNDLIQVAAGDKVPVDGIIVEGSSYLNEAMLTGESVPLFKTLNAKVFAGTLNGDGLLLIKSTAVNEQTKLHHIISLVESAQMTKAPILQLVDKISAMFVPIVMLIALLTFSAWFALTGDIEQALINSVAVLVIACPCALGLATPTAMVVGTGLAAQKGILIKDINTLQLAHKLNVIAFDKTGTLTKGQVSLKNITALDDQFLSHLFGLQQSSKHPIAKSITAYCTSRNVEPTPIKDIQVIHGEGLRGTLHQQVILAGNEKLLARFHIDLNQQCSLHGIAPFTEHSDNIIYVCLQQTLIGYFTIQDQVRSESKQAITNLHEMGLNTVLLSGDKQQVVNALSKELNIKTHYSRLTPEQKCDHLSELQKHSLVAMVGDGVNDAPALALADISIAMGGGSDVAKQTASMTLLRDDPRLIAEAITLSKATWKTIQQNLFWAFMFNVLAIPAAALGYLSPTIAAFAMTASSLIVLSNSLILKHSS